MFGYKPFTPEARQSMLDDSVPQIGTQATNAAADATGTTRPDQVTPATSGQALARSAASGAVGMAGLGAGLSGADAIVPSVVMGAGSGVASTAAQSAVPPEYAPAAGVLAGAAAGTALGAAPMAAGRVIDNVTGPLLTPRRVAGNQLYSAATDPEAALGRLTAAATPPEPIPDAPAGTAAPGPGEIVPGSQPTSYQLTGDSGLGAVENAFRVQNRTPYDDRAAQQNAARVDAVQRLAPADANPEAVSTAFRGMLDDMTAQDAAATSRSRDAATGAVDALPGNLPTAPGQTETALQTLGGKLQEGLAQQRAAAKTAESGLWNAIDPDGSLTVNMDPIAARAQQIAAQQPKTAAPLSPIETGIYQTAQDTAGGTTLLRLDGVPLAGDGRHPGSADGPGWSACRAPAVHDAGGRRRRADERYHAEGASRSGGSSSWHAGAGGCVWTGA